MDDRHVFRTEVKRYKKIVIWGFRTRFHTHRYIHAAFYDNLKKLGASVVWVEDAERNKTVVSAGDLVIAMNMAARHIPYVAGAYYCLHNFDENELTRQFEAQVDRTHSVRLQVYKNSAEQSDQKWDEVTYFDSYSRTLYQPWGTNLLAEEFKPPVVPRGRLVFWVGSVWNNALNQGNIQEINELKTILAFRGLRFVQLRFIGDALNTFFIRRSRLAPAIGGAWQVQQNYLPCRMFKNISYGQLGFSNIKKFDSLFHDAYIPGHSIAELVDNALALSASEYVRFVVDQQSVVRRHTYLQKCINIFKAFVA
jgi:hypothetical protein